MLAVGGAALTVFSAVAFASGGTSWEILDRSEPAYVWGLGGLLALLACIPFAIRWQRRSRDLRAGRVRIVEGATRKVRRTMGAGNTFEKVGFLYADRARFRASAEAYAAAPASGRIRLFVVGSPDEVVNFEALT